MDLISRAQAGDRGAFAALFEGHKNLVYKTAYLILGDAHEAEDALQEGFLLVHKSLTSFDVRKGVFTTWLCRIALNFCLNHRRKRHHPSLGYFTIRTFTDKPLEDTSWADEAYTTASGLVLYFVNQPSITTRGEEFNGGLMQAPNGMTYAIESTLSRDQIKAFLEELVLVK